MAGKEGNAAAPLGTPGKVEISLAHRNPLQPRPHRLLFPLGAARVPRRPRSTRWASRTPRKHDRFSRRRGLCVELRELRRVHRLRGVAFAAQFLPAVSSAQHLVGFAFLDRAVRRRPAAPLMISPLPRSHEQV